MVPLLIEFDYTMFGPANPDDLLSLTWVRNNSDEERLIWVSHDVNGNDVVSILRWDEIIGTRTQYDTETGVPKSSEDPGDLIVFDNQNGFLLIRLNSLVAKKAMNAWVFNCILKYGKRSNVLGA